MGSKAELTIKNSSFDGTIATAHTVGGLIGRAATSSAAIKSLLIENCTVKGALSSTGDQVGGFLGICDVSEFCTIRNSTCQATVKGSKLAGGFIGNARGGSIKLDGCKIVTSVTGATAGDWAAQGTVTTVNCIRE